MKIYFKRIIGATLFIVSASLSMHAAWKVPTKNGEPLLAVYDFIKDHLTLHLPIDEVITGFTFNTERYPLRDYERYRPVRFSERTKTWYIGDRVANDKLVKYIKEVMAVHNATNDEIEGVYEEETTSNTHTRIYQPRTKSGQPLLAIFVPRRSTQHRYDYYDYDYYDDVAPTVPEKKYVNFAFETNLCYDPVTFSWATGKWYTGKERANDTYADHIELVLLDNGIKIPHVESMGIGALYKKIKNMFT